MLFNSIDFLIFFPIVALGYFIIPAKVKYLWLLAASYYFYMSWNPKYALLMLLSTVATWLSGLLIAAWKNGREGEKYLPPQKWCLIGCILLNLGILFFFKYYHFAASNLEAFFKIVGITLKAPAFDVILPVGISFYTFQALGYVFDVYRGEIEAEKNLLRYALFVSFFPQLVAGPIERSKNLMRQMHEVHPFDYDRVKDGLLLMGWGFFQKLVIADRIAIVVTKIFDSYGDYTGFHIVGATVLFAFQIYCDFAGYSDIAIGAARVMGFSLMKNFKSPYLTTTVSDFWRNWHISLTTWFRDYIYIPLGGNRHGRLKKYRNLLITFGVSGLWHGASWNYVAWGLLNGLYQIAGDLTRPYRQRLQQKLGIRTSCGSWYFLQGLATFVFVDFAWLFFRANGFRTALKMIKHTITNPLPPLLQMDGKAFTDLVTLGLGKPDFIVLMVALAILFFADYFKRKVDLKAVLARQNLWFRWLVYYALIFSILIFGVYGPEYNASQFIYFQF